MILVKEIFKGSDIDEFINNKDIETKAIKAIESIPVDKDQNPIGIFTITVEWNDK